MKFYSTKEDIKFAVVFEQIYLETNHPDRLFHCSRVINFKKRTQSTGHYALEVLNRYLSLK